MKRLWMVLAVAGLASGQDSASDVTRRVFDDLEAAAGRVAQDYMKLKDYELATVAFGLAESRTEGGKWKAALEKLRCSRSLTRSNVAYVNALFKYWEQKLQVLKKIASSDAESVRLELLAAEMKHLPAFVEALRSVNDMRGDAKLPYCGFSYRLSESCMRHCRYMTLEGDYGHFEKKTSVYYSEEGESAGKASCLNNIGTPQHAVEIHLSTLFHRIPFLNAGVRSIGFGYWPVERTQYTAIDCTRDMEKVDHIFIYPFSGQKDVPTQFCLGAGSERPNPLPEDASGAGYPITLTFFGDTLQKAAFDEMKASLSDARGGEISCYLSWPNRPANASMTLNYFSIGLIPKAALAHRQTYKAVIQVKLQGERRRYETVFSTAKK